MILAFDTATDQLTVALGGAGTIAARFHEPAPRAHLGQLLPTIDSLLDRSGHTRREISHIAVGTGPGSFTGLRIGVATAQGLAYALQKPLVGIATLDIIARGVAHTVTERIYPVIDAKRQEVYTAEYDHQGNRLNKYRVVYPADLAARIADTGDATVMAGDALYKYREIFSSTGKNFIKFSVEPLWKPDASVLIKLAEERIEEAEIVPYHKVLPIYTRLSDAEENLKREESSQRS